MIIVQRRIGGLEMLLEIFTQITKVQRRIGGLEKAANGLLSRL